MESGSRDHHCDCCATAVATAPAAALVLLPLPPPPPRVRVSVVAGGAQVAVEPDGDGDGDAGEGARDPVKSDGEARRSSRMGDAIFRLVPRLNYRSRVRPLFVLSQLLPSPTPPLTPHSKS